jgi:very-short-patch-repair endonuclease
MSELPGESELVQRVMQMLKNAGYRVKSQWPVGTNCLDLVVEGAGKRLAVECDGDRQCAEEQLAEDMARQAILERLGWRFARIRGSQFFRDPERAIEALLTRLRLLGIPPEGAQSSANASEEEEAELQERIFYRAAELRLEWMENGDAQEAQTTPPVASGWGQPWRRQVVVEETKPIPPQVALLTQDARHEADSRVVPLPLGKDSPMVDLDWDRLWSDWIQKQSGFSQP